jgi:hypothetical protein
MPQSKSAVERADTLDPYPFWVLRDRYGGSYSGGKYTCWWGLDVREEAESDDVTCGGFWYEMKQLNNTPFDGAAIGVGDSIDAAITDAMSRLALSPRSKSGGRKR